MDLVNRLKLFLESQKIAISQFADTCRIPRPTMSQILNGRNKKISDELITKIHEAYPSLSVLWLMFGEGDMLNSSNIEISEPENGVNSENPSPQNVVNYGVGALNKPQIPDAEISSEKITSSNSGEPGRNSLPKAGDSTNERTMFNGQATKSPSSEFEGSLSSFGAFGDSFALRESTEKDVTFADASSTFSKSSETIDFHNDVNSLSGEFGNDGQEQSEFSSQADGAKRQNAGMPKSFSIDDCANIPLNTVPGKKISTIVVLYSDNSFDIFNPA